MSKYKLNEIYMRDPFIYVEDDTCYLLGTTDENSWNGPAKSFLGYKSKDLINFEGPYVLFEKTKDFWADEHFWAPELHKINGKYYIFASFHKKGRHRASQALMSDSPFGKYVPCKKPFTPSDFESLDATYVEENNKKYSIFCREWVQTRDGEMYVGELNDDFTELTNLKMLFKASEAKWTKAFNNGSIENNYITDGPFIYKTKSGRLILLWSSNSEKGYALGLAYSDDGLYGKWRHFDEPLYDHDGGHGMIFKFKDKIYLTLHTCNSQSLQERPIILKVIEKDSRLWIKI